MKELSIKDFTKKRFTVEYIRFVNELLNFINAETFRNDLEFTHFFRVVDALEELNKAILFCVEDKWLESELQKIEDLKHAG